MTVAADRFPCVAALEEPLPAETSQEPHHVVHRGVEELGVDRGPFAGALPDEVEDLSLDIAATIDLRDAVGVDAGTDLLGCCALPLRIMTVSRAAVPERDWKRFPRVSIPAADFVALHLGEGDGEIAIADGEVQLEMIGIEAKHLSLVPRRDEAV